MTQSDASTVSIVRPLTAQEGIYWQLTYTDQIHPVLAAHVSGPSHPEQWRAALAALQARHPSLSVSIEAPDNAGTSGPTQPFVRRHSNKPIPLRVVQRASTPRWEAEIERELSIPFHCGDVPLARAVLIHGDTSSVFILSVSHSICDGVSLSFLLRDVLAAMAGQRLEPLAYPRSAEALLDIAPVAPAKAAEETLPDSRPTTNMPSVRSLRFSQALTGRVVELSRQQRTTVHGALAAATVLALRELMPHFGHDPVRIISPVNVRAVLGVGDDCGMYFASPKAVFDPAQPRDFWSMAREARQNIVDGSTREALVAATTGMQSMTAAGLTRAAAADSLNHAFAIDALLTNLGQTPYASTFGQLTLESLWVSVLAGQATQTIGVSTTQGALGLLLSARQPVEGLLDTMQRIIADICA